ncbi:aldo/keto reductase [Labrys wisconsinensis]|uniref:Aryl-alcohol dehydrogenase-like predicted oxidoreductase/enamine deaminase RidA (YjgF/YER057c/UK114 family) n=1 Tax=Labrys wisconsinensis TaxID=425677 RepID=A0ABU0JHY9_9HYPH|nr:aldo/keto reductase [Labrys wisconsinensis]MDQ0472859.1 aryl-alcohol dehydrogenase-like predicted oxidoreductase/enamine deaminase RidA (YjgF/YER057c/UK114 family) [Labrys wisconsinensis]
MPPTRPSRTELAPGLSISRMVTGLWQVADMERGSQTLDPQAGADALAAYAAAGFDTFDMADHYGSAEIIAGTLLARERAAGGQRSAAFTKWCPVPGPMTADVVRAGVERSLTRLGVSTIDLLQFHWWTFEHPAYLDAMKALAKLREEGLIRQLGVTNFDTDHLHVLIGEGVPIVSNQVSFSVLDRRAAKDMSAFCLAHGIRLLAYGTLAGGLVSERWLGQPEPDALSDWSKMKYKRFVDAIGGWAAFQRILQALQAVAARHGVSIANVATRWVLEQPAVAAVIVGARLGEGEHRADNLNSFGFALDAADHAALDEAFRGARRLPGDCGDEYRKPPFLTASGDLSHHLASVEKVYRAVPVEGRPGRLRVDTGSVWEGICGYSRAVRIGERILVSGTTATNAAGEAVCPDDPAGQAVFILDKIAASLAALGGSLADIVRTRVYLKNADEWEPVSRVHGRYLGEVRPVNTLFEVARLVGPYRVEIEAEAIVDPGA